MNRVRLALFNKYRAVCEAWKKIKCRTLQEGLFYEWVVNQEVIQNQTKQQKIGSFDYFKFICSKSTTLGMHSWETDN